MPECPSSSDVRKIWKSSRSLSTSIFCAEHAAAKINANAKVLVLLAIVHFSCGYCDGQTIIRRRQRARRKRRECAWRIDRLVEIECHFAIFRQRCVDEACAAIGRLPAGVVANDEEQTVPFEHRVEPIFFAGLRERDI